MIESIGYLQNFWHAIAFSTELRRGRALRRRIYDRPLLIWRDTDDCIHAMDDCCLHQKAPLEVKDYSGNTLVCPYHGWQYDQTGKVTSVPSDSCAAEKICSRIPVYSLREADGFVWISLCKTLSSESSLPDLSSFEHWPRRFRMLEFATSEELLIDNFMDPTHTAIVHDGIIRSSGEPTDHQLTITSHAKGVRVDYAERHEKVGPGMSYLFGDSVGVQHTDEFLLPNLVRVTYTINRVPRFLAMIACTPIGPLNGGQTLAFIQLRYQLGWPTRFVGPFVSWIANKVLRQDYKITALQFANRQAFSESPDHRVAADAVAVHVAKLRKQMISCDQPVATSRQTINLRF
ncbi:MAG: Rieske 2Fe-2S domain-containing protein [Planctomycetaceae bacterium]